ncbi:MAG: PhzF family phenazine biosynthesis protein [Polyangiaceae bacterium]
MPTLLFHVNAFTRVPFRGNPAAVVILDEPHEEAWMQSVAREMNLSETAFVMPIGDNEFALRWFTPLTEVPLCGHATLAAAHVLLREGVVTGEMTFATRSGLLHVAPSGEALAMTFPRFETEPAESPQIVKALGVNAVETRLARDAAKLVVRVATEQEVLDVAPDLEALLNANDIDVRGVIVTASTPPNNAGPAPHFVSRYFAPWVGIAEDPVTGSAHSVLGPFWSERLGRKRFLAAQRSTRGGDLGVEVRDDAVLITGSCVSISRGMLSI